MTALRDRLQVAHFPPVRRQWRRPKTEQSLCETAWQILPKCSFVRNYTSGRVENSPILKTFQSIAGCTAELLNGLAIGQQAYRHLAPSGKVMARLLTAAVGLVLRAQRLPKRTGSPLLLPTDPAFGPVKGRGVIDWPALFLIGRHAVAELADQASRRLVVAQPVAGRQCRIKQFRGSGKGCLDRAPGRTFRPGSSGRASRLFVPPRVILRLRGMPNSGAYDRSPGLLGHGGNLAELPVDVAFAGWRCDSEGGLGAG